MAKRHKPTFVSTFAGMGGFDLAFTRRGAKCLAQVECDPQCLSVLRRHFPKTRRFKDIREFNRASIAVRPDIIVGGFPCQDLSVAGRRAGLSGERSVLGNAVAVPNVEWIAKRMIEQLSPNSSAV